MVESFPLQWPAGWSKCSFRKFAAFKSTNVTNKLLTELRRLKATNIVISSNMATYRKGNIEIPYANQNITDPGVAVYFTKDGKQQCIPCDKWKTIDQNIRAIALTIEALRGIDRWGAKEMVDAAFSGFKALPGPDDINTVPIKTAREIIGVSSDCVDLEYIKFKYRNKAKELHPDSPTGDKNEFQKLNAAFEELEKELNE